MIRGFPVLFVLLFVSDGIPIDQSAQIAVEATSETKLFPETAAVVPLDKEQKEEVEEKELKKETKLRDEIDNIEKLQDLPETAVVQENSELKINDKVNLNRMSTTDCAKIVESTEPPIDSVAGLEPDEDGEQLRQPSEKELAELSERFKEKEESTKDGTMKLKPTMKTKETETEAEVREELDVKTTEHVLVTREPEKEEVVKTIEEDIVSDGKKEATITDGVMNEEHELMDKEEEVKPVEKEDNGVEELETETEEEKISWELVQFLIMLTPTDKEVSWFTIVVEAVKCSLRNCPNPNSYWHRRPMYLPRITRHRRQDSDFEQVPTTQKPCLCQNLETYFEKLYETIGKTKKKEMNETRSDV